MNLTKEEMYYKLTHNIPSGFESVEISKELNVLRRAISSNGRGISIRSLFEQIPNVIRKLCPCMLMSPISVAQYISSENEPVDIVIFDEASQIPTCKAVGVLARGNNAVIVGDPNQMPPTSFFAGNTVDEDNLDIEDLDSILDDCLALGMPQAHLKWHYRSKHESLIAFSNREFYENCMLTFPSRNDRERRVQFYKTNGFFDRGKGRVNISEAQAIVDEIKRRYNNPVLRKKSIGVVTFNISQQTLIEDMLASEYQKDSAFDEWANFGKEKLFVKNLENVQGDERDIILFSIAFGPDSEGKLSMNFGPLNRNGGWKRLNVAVSRARYEMIVYSTMTSDMIDLRRTKSKGVEALKDFLEFAEKGRLPGKTSDDITDVNEGIMNSLCNAISNAGFGYQTHIGHSNFKIDIAVINPYDKDEYLLGIMLDGDLYKQSANTKDREVSQLDVLDSLGWCVVRIWTMDWWDNRDKQIKGIINILNDKKSEAKAFVKSDMTADLPDSADESCDFIQDNFIADMTPQKMAEENSENIIDNVVHKEDTNEKLTLQVKLSDVSENEISKDISTSKDKVASMLTENAVPTTFVTPDISYEVIDYTHTNLEITQIFTSDYIKKSNLDEITARADAIVEVEAPISHDRLIKIILRSFGIGRSSVQTIEATEKAIKKSSAKVNRQNGVKFYWRENQNSDEYGAFRVDVSGDDQRNIVDISQQEIKNAICKTIADKEPMDKNTLLKSALRTMGYKRTTATLLENAERGLKYGKKTGEIVINEDKKFCLSN